MTEVSNSLTERCKSIEVEEVAAMFFLDIYPGEINAHAQKHPPNSPG